MYAVVSVTRRIVEVISSLSVPVGRPPSCCFITLGTQLGNQLSNYTFQYYCIYSLLGERYDIYIYIYIYIL
jgi:hypothetical protein